MTATDGRVAASSAGVVELVEPWWPTFSRSTGSSPRLTSAASTGASASPVSNALNPP